MYSTRIRKWWNISFSHLLLFVDFKILPFCIFHLEEACEKLVGTPIVKDMLTIATNEELSKDVKNNTAIALAKLVKNDQRYVDWKN